MVTDLATALLLVIAAVSFLVLGVQTGYWLALRREALRPEDPYAQLHRRVTDLPAGARPTRAEVDEWQRELHHLDALRVAESPPENRWLRWHRALPSLWALTAVTAIGAGVLGEWDLAVGILVAALLASPVSVLLVIAVERSAALLRTARTRAQASYRIEIRAILGELELRAARRVPGLGERVARALAILREQQKPDDREPTP